MAAKKKRRRKKVAPDAAAEEAGAQAANAPATPPPSSTAAVSAGRTAVGLTDTGLVSPAARRAAAAAPKPELTSSGKVRPRGAPAVSPADGGAPSRARAHQPQPSPQLPIGRSAQRKLLERDATLRAKYVAPRKAGGALTAQERMVRDAAAAVAAKEQRRKVAERMREWEAKKAREGRSQAQAAARRRAEEAAEDAEERAQRAKADRAFKKWCDGKAAAKAADRKTTAAAKGGGQGPIKLAEAVFAFRQQRMQPYELLDHLEYLASLLSRGGRLDLDKFRSQLQLADVQARVDRLVAELREQAAAAAERPPEQLTPAVRQRQQAEGVQLRIGLQILRNISPGRKAFGMALNSMRQMFDSMDEDGNGVLSKEEFKEGLKRLDLGISSTQLVDLTKKFDADNDGNIDFSEFEGFLLHCKAKLEMNEPRKPDTKFDATVALAGAHPAGSDGVRALLLQIEAAVRTHRREVASGGGGITAAQYRKAVASLYECAQLTHVQRKDAAKAMDTVFRTIDRKHTGSAPKVAVDGFLRMVEKETLFRADEQLISPEVKRADETKYRLSKRLFEVAELRRTTPERVFAAIEAACSSAPLGEGGRMAATDFMRIMRRLDVGLSSVQLDEFSRALDPAKHGIKPAGLLRYLAGAHDRMLSDEARKKDPLVGICDGLIRDIAVGPGVMLSVVSGLRDCMFGDEVVAPTPPPQDGPRGAPEGGFDITGWDRQDEATRRGLTVVTGKKGAPSRRGSLAPAAGSPSASKVSLGSADGRRARLESQTEAMRDLRDFQQHAAREAEARAAL